MSISEMAPGRRIAHRFWRGTDGSWLHALRHGPRLWCSRQNQARQQQRIEQGNRVQRCSPGHDEPWDDQGHCWNQQMDWVQQNCWGQNNCSDQEKPGDQGNPDHRKTCGDQAADDHQNHGAHQAQRPLARVAGSAGRRWVGRTAVAGSAGFSLVELILALGAGTALCLAILQALQLQGEGSERLARLLRERTVQQRTLELIRSEVLRAGRLELGTGGSLVSPCGLSGRRPVLQLLTSAGTIVYSLGAPPSPIWRGQVLMRCGPAYGLDGEPSAGASQNRVLLDGLATTGFAAVRPGPGQLSLSLRQRFSLRDGRSQEISSGLQMVTAEEAGPTAGL